MRFVVLALIAFVALGNASSFAADAGPDGFYSLEKLPDPPSKKQLEVGGMNFADDGTLYMGTRRGDIWAWKNGKYTLFATGISECLGLLPTEPGVVYATQRSEISKISDTNKDGVADRYETFCDDFAYGGNYHEYNFGLLRDKSGNFYGTLNLQHNNTAEWGSRYMGTGIKDRGTAYKISPDGKYSTFAWGLRSPNGIFWGPDDQMFYADNQGEYVATNSIYHLMEGKFYGHPASLSFKTDFKGSSDTTTNEDLDAMRVRPAVYFPYSRVGKSVTEARLDSTGGLFGPFDGQLFVGDTNSPIITRVFLEKVDGEYQGACIPFMTHPDLEGTNRIAFGADGALYAGLTNRGWAAGTSGLRRVKWSGKVPLEILKIELQTDGFLLTFTKPLKPESASKIENVSVVRWYYEYHDMYGSDEFDKTPVTVSKVELSADGKQLKVILPEVLEKHMYQIELQRLTSPDDNSRLRNNIAWYTLNALRK